MDAVLPLSHPIHGVDDASMNEVVVPRGMNIVVVIMAGNRNKDLWGDDAYRWKEQ